MRSPKKVKMKDCSDLIRFEGPEADEGGAKLVRFDVRILLCGCGFDVRNGCRVFLHKVLSRLPKRSRVLRACEQIRTAPAH